jgi:hypothetical protein
MGTGLKQSQSQVKMPTAKNRLEYRNLPGPEQINSSMTVVYGSSHEPQNVELSEE